MFYYTMTLKIDYKWIPMHYKKTGVGQKCKNSPYIGKQPPAHVVKKPKAATFMTNKSKPNRN